MGRIILWWKASEVNALLLFGLLGEEYSLDVGEYTALGNGDTGEEFVQLFVITDGELEMTGDDPGLLIATGCLLTSWGGGRCLTGMLATWGGAGRLTAWSSMA